VNVADRGHKAGGHDHVDAGHGHQPLICGESMRPRDQPLDLSDLCVEELDLAHRARRRSRAPRRQLEAGEPAPALDAEQVANGGRPTSRRINTAWISFLTRERVAPAARDAPAAGASPTIADRASTPRPATPAASSRARCAHPAGRSSRAPWRIPVSDGLHRPATARRGLDDPRDLPQRYPSPPSDAIHRGPGSRRTARSLGLVVAIRPQERSSPLLDSATSQKSDAASNPPTSPAPPSPRQDRRETRWANDKPTIRALKGATGTSRRGGQPKSRLQTPIVQEPACPTMRSPRSPCPGSPELTGQARQQASGRHFHAPKLGSAKSTGGVQRDASAHSSRQSA
jgi:hypothetical protein